MSAFARGSFQNNAFQGDGVVVPVAVPSRGGGRVRRKSYAVEINGEYRFFSSWDELEEFLASLKERELEKAEETVDKVVGRILKTGKAPKKALRIKVQKAPQEVREQVDLLNAELERVFWRKVSEEIAARGEEEDIEVLLVI